MKIGAILPVADDAGTPTPPWPSIRSFAQAAERLGLDSVWMFDHFFYRPPNGPIEGQHEAWTIVSAVAAVTERVEIGTLVLCSSFRSPTLVANTMTVNPIAAGLLAAALLDEPITANLIVGLIAVVAGISIATISGSSLVSRDSVSTPLSAKPMRRRRPT